MENLDSEYDFDFDGSTLSSMLNLTNMTTNTTPIIDYEYPIITDPPLGELIPVSIVYGLTLVLGMLGNILVIFSVTRYLQMSTVTNTFLLSLASADLLLVLVCVPVKVRKLKISCMYS